MSPTSALDRNTASSVERALQNLDDWLRRRFLLFSIALLIVNFIGSIIIIHKVSYTEIDWETYMIQVSLFLGGERDYKNISGPTGPLVYPAAHVYLYSILHGITSHGENIRLGQYLFAIAHSIALALVLRLFYVAQRVPLYLTPLLFLSRRVLSLFVLRLFNDALQTIPLYAALLFFTQNSWFWGCVLFSFSVAIKMNALLYAPGLAVVLCQAVGFPRALLLAFSVCLPIQILLGAPFLLEEPVSYLARAFELTRKFLFKWSVNGAFLPEHIFTDPMTSIALLAAHLVSLLIFAHTRWTSSSTSGLLGLLNSNTWNKRRCHRLKPTHILLVLLSSNFIGIVFARTLHYQFYLWYAHSLVFLLWKGPLNTAVKLGIIVIVEAAFNIYPPHHIAASLLNVAHMVVLLSLFAEKRATDETIYENEPDHRKHE